MRFHLKNLRSLEGLFFSTSMRPAFHAFRFPSNSGSPPRGSLIQVFQNGEMFRLS